MPDFISYAEQFKQEAGVYAIEGRLSPGSIRDQVFRGSLVAEAVARLMKDKPGPVRLVVVGAGASGFAFTTQVCALSKDCNLKYKVTMLETDWLPFGSQRGCSHRLVSPTLYEWPSAYSDDKKYENGRVSLFENSASRLAGEWTLEFARMKDEFGENLEFRPRTKYLGSREIAGSRTVEVLDLEKHHPFVIDQIDFLILCRGVGAEQTRKDNFVSFGFWQADCLPSRVGDWDRPDLTSRPDGLPLAIIGSGDGGITDAVRVVTQGLHAREVLSRLEEIPGVKCLRHFFAEEDAWSRGAATGLASSFSHKDRIFRQLVRDQLKDTRVREKIWELIRFKDLILFQDLTTLGPCFALNRFLAHMFNEVWGGPGLIRFDRTVNKVKCDGHQHDEVDPLEKRAMRCFTGAHVIEFANGETMRVGAVLLRAGVTFPNGAERRLTDLVPQWIGDWQPSSRAKLLAQASAYQTPARADAAETLK